MMHKTFFLILVIFLVSCNYPGAGLDLVTLPPTATETSTPLPTDTPTETPSAPSSEQNCYFNWATQSLPDLSKQVQAALDSAGLKGATGIAEAYGEECYSYQNEPVRFATMETDFRISVEVPSLEDREALGNLVEQIWTVLQQFPPGSTPGPKPGYVGITFRTGDQEAHLWFQWETGQAAIQKGLHGAALYAEVQKK